MTTAPWYAPYLAKASGWLSDAASLADMAQGSTVNLAVTGLSRSGKTVFITSLIHNLLSAVHNPNRMPLLSVVGGGRLIGTRLESAGAGRLPRFRYQDNIEAMAAGAPGWPAGTDDLREIGIEVRFMPANAPGKILSEISGSPATITIGIVDYPGEWLLDLPLLGQSYAEWSRATLRLYRRGVRAEAAADFLAFIAQHRHDETANEETAKQAHDLYRAFLIKARDVHGLSHLQPGRFLCPGNLADAPFLWFAPLDVSDKAVFTPNTLGALMEGRYDVYKREVVARFYEDHFRWFSRQIVLVDVLRALLAGREAFEDQRLALEAILQSFRYGSGSLFSKLIRGPHIDKRLPNRLETSAGDPAPALRPQWVRLLERRDGSADPRRCARDCVYDRANMQPWKILGEKSERCRSRERDFGDGDAGTPSIHQNVPTCAVVEPSLLAHPAANSRRHRHLSRLTSAGYPQ